MPPAVSCVWDAAGPAAVDHAGSVRSGSVRSGSVRSGSSLRRVLVRAMLLLAGVVAAWILSALLNSGSAQAETAPAASSAPASGSQTLLAQVQQTLQTTLAGQPATALTQILSATPEDVTQVVASVPVIGRSPLVHQLTNAVIAPTVAQLGDTASAVLAQAVATGQNPPGVGPLTTGVPDATNGVARPHSGPDAFLSGDLTTRSGPDQSDGTAAGTMGTVGTGSAPTSPPAPAVPPVPSPPAPAGASTIYFLYAIPTHGPARSTSGSAPGTGSTQSTPAGALGDEPAFAPD
jgi:hypothetical protein